MNRTAVVIPLYNHEAYIGPALDSVLNQSRPPDRVIIVDDGSKDHSVERVREFDDPRITLVEQANQGAHAALNRAIATAEESDCIAILNSDDVYEPRRLEACGDYLAAHPETQLLVTGLNLIDSQGQPLPADEPRSKWFDAVWSWQNPPPPLVEWLALANFAATTSNFVARRDWLLAHPFRPYRYVHDYFALNLAALQDVLALHPEPLLRYRVHPANTISTVPQRLILEVLKMHADLARDVSPKLLEDHGLRQRWSDYLRRGWMNVSAFRADLFAVLCTRGLEQLDEAQLQQWLDELADLPEAGRFPNRSLVNRHEGKLPLGPESGLAEHYDRLARELSILKQEKKAAAPWREVQRLLSRSRWLALVRLLGGAAGLIKTSETDLASEDRRSCLADSPWLRVGAALGSRSCRKISRLLRETPSDENHP